MTSCNLSPGRAQPTCDSKSKIRIQRHRPRFGSSAAKISGCDGRIHRHVAPCECFARLPMRRPPRLPSRDSHPHPARNRILFGAQCELVNVNVGCLRQTVAIPLLPDPSLRCASRAHVWSHAAFSLTLLSLCVCLSLSLSLFAQVIIRRDLSSLWRGHRAPQPTAQPVPSDAHPEPSRYHTHSQRGGCAWCKIPPPAASRRSVEQQPDHLDEQWFYN